MDYKEIIDKLVRELSFRVGIPNIHNKEHQSIMSEILSEWGEYDVKETIFEFLTEKDETFTARKKDTGEVGVFKSKDSRDAAIKAGTHEPIDKKDDEEPKKDTPKVNIFDKTPKSTLDRTNFDKKDDKKYKDNPGGPTRKEILDDLNNGNIDVLSKYQDGVSINRTKRIAGKGGQKPSEGESKFCAAVDTNFEKWEKDNKQTIDRVQIEIQNRTKKADEIRTATQLGMDVDSPEFNRYLAKREIWTEQKIEENKETAIFKKDFGRNKQTKENPLGQYTEWMHAAFDGAIQTQNYIKKIDIFDLSKPHKTIQSTTEVDEAVQAHLEDNLKNAKTDEDKKHAKKQLKNWNKYKSYHDTYIIGKDKKGRTTYFGISNKKGDAMKDPQNNSTPAKRFKALKERYGEKVAKGVASSLDKNIKRVTEVKQKTVRTASTLEITDEFVKICETPKMEPYIQKLRDNGKFRDYLKAKGLNPDTIGTKELLVEMNNHSQQLLKAGGKPSYGTYGKIAIKIGELSQVDKFRKNNPNINFDDSSIQKSIDIKQTEKETVKESHKSFVSDLEEVDSPDGYHSTNNKDADNGPHQQGYVSGVLDACHIDSYIDSEDDDGMLVQMGINTVTPSMIRECVAQRSGYKGDFSTPEGKRKLKEHLRKRCRITPGESSVRIMNEGKEEELFDDTWRTAGESQKIATGFGEGMRDCLITKAAK